ncbi:MAG TPA: CHRD domain-containing protein [Chitinophagaceae bacterium]|nr:CHRD domain-containing protein [Chitinophagaceae bacterium]
MKWIKLTVLSSTLFALFIQITACDTDEELKKTTLYSKTNIPLTGAQETPPNNSSALGSMDVSYNTTTRILNYTVRWSGLAGAPIGMHIHGLAPTGYVAPVVQSILGSSNPTLFPANGSYSGTLLADGVVVKEQNLLNGFYYMNIHTATYPAGEIRGQITFQ